MVLILGVAAGVAAQTEVLTNAKVIEMARAGLSEEVIVTKIERSDIRFDTSADALVELKNAGVTDKVIKLMIERASTVLPGVAPRDTETRETQAEAGRIPASGRFSPQEAVLQARTIAFEKSSVHPARQNLEKALLKRQDFKELGLTIARYRDEADLFVEIGFVSGSWFTHRYAYRIFDRRSGAVIAAGETTSWGSLSENLAKHITRSLLEVTAGK